MEIPVFTTHQKTPVAAVRLVSDMAGHLHQEYETCQSAFQAQPLEVKKFLEQQAAALVDDLFRPPKKAAYRLPAEVACQMDPGKDPELIQVPEGCQNQQIQARGRHLKVEDIWQHFYRLEQS